MTTFGHRIASCSPQDWTGKSHWFDQSMTLGVRRFSGRVIDSVQPAQTWALSLSELYRGFEFLPTVFKFSPPLAHRRLRHAPKAQRWVSSLAK